MSSATYRPLGHIIYECVRRSSIAARDRQQLLITLRQAMASNQDAAGQCEPPARSVLRVSDAQTQIVVSRVDPILTRRWRRFRVHCFAIRAAAEASSCTIDASKQSCGQHCAVCASISQSNILLLLYDYEFIYLLLLRNAKRIRRLCALIMHNGGQFATH